MTVRTASRRLHWSVVVPPAAAVVLAFTWQRPLSGVLNGVVSFFLIAAVLAAVHHAEVVAERIGQPYGALVLAVAVTVIEVALIVTMMVDGGEKSSALARDTVFAAVMITCNGIVGLSLLLVALRRGEAFFSAEGTGTQLATVTTLAGLSLVLPKFTTSEPGPVFATGQLAFAALASIALYGVFVATQTVRHREKFLPVTPGGEVIDDMDDPAHRPSKRTARWGLGLLLLALVCVVGLAKGVSPAIEDGLDAAGLPRSAVGAAIALLVLLPESIAAVREAGRDRVQTSLNLAYGSAIASIGLTIPTVAIASIWLEGPLKLGLGSSQLVLLTMTVVVGTLTVTHGRATLQQGGVHLALFAAYLVLAVMP
ncbi:calcium:proton antiporter [Streptomyces sp. NPDC004134]|uniref:calcium:proton antiporter n=1 Tax=Streptomyces sp. NPDC004134 TaxID=3364691 RepID=UPI0036BB7FE0